MNRYRNNTKLKLCNIVIDFILIVASFLISGYLRGYIKAGAVKLFWIGDMQYFVYYYLAVALMGVVLYLIMGKYATLHLDFGIMELF